MQRLAAAAVDAAPDQVPRDQNQEPQENDPGNTAQIAGHAVEGFDTRLARGDDAAAQLSLENALGPAGEQDPPQHCEADNGAQGCGEDNLAGADNRAGDDQAGPEVLDRRAEAAGRLASVFRSAGVGSGVYSIYHGSTATVRFSLAEAKAASTTACTTKPVPPSHSGWRSSRTARTKSSIIGRSM
jgi:hypothetical protein